ncbi:hypothetical protein [Streptomyces kanasensis]|uniref:hypothetical protein n=1 Tax=Streptomyces kanasensis TaxID=936756 RepID=UPI0036F8D2F6
MSCGRVPAAAPGGVPPVRRVTERQRRGADCVHCGVVLTPRTAVDLGRHDYKPDDWVDYHLSWWPRSCRSCHHRRTPHEGGPLMTDGKHAGPPSDKPWNPPPAPPSPDGSGPGR